MGKLQQFQASLKIKQKLIERKYFLSHEHKISISVYLTLDGQGLVVYTGKEYKIVDLNSLIDIDYTETTKYQGLRRLCVREESDYYYISGTACGYVNEPEIGVVNILQAYEEDDKSTIRIKSITAYEYIEKLNIPNKLSTETMNFIEEKEVEYADLVNSFNLFSSEVPNYFIMNNEGTLLDIRINSEGAFLRKQGLNDIIIDNPDVTAYLVGRQGIYGIRLKPYKRLRFIGNGSINTNFDLRYVVSDITELNSPDSDKLELLKAVGKILIRNRSIDSSYRTLLIKLTRQEFISLLKDKEYTWIRLLSHYHMDAKFVIDDSIIIHNIRGDFGLFIGEDYISLNVLALGMNNGKLQIYENNNIQEAVEHIVDTEIIPSRELLYNFMDNKEEYSNLKISEVLEALNEFIEQSIIRGTHE